MGIYVTQEQQLEILKLRRHGISGHDIAKQLSVKHNQVYQVLKSYGITKHMRFEEEIELAKLYSQTMKELMAKRFLEVMNDPEIRERIRKLDGDLDGKRYGKLVVIHACGEERYWGVKIRNGKRYRYWTTRPLVWVRCDCGHETAMRRYNLVYNHAKSCLKCRATYSRNKLKIVD